MARSKAAGGLRDIRERVLNAGADFIDTSGDIYFYYGFPGEWRVLRTVRATGESMNAAESTNPNYSDFDSAWVDRETLSYA